MTAPMVRALRTLAPNDFRLIWRDSFLLFILLALPLACLLFRWLVPAATELVAEWVELERYYGLILAYMLGQQPVVLGYVVGILFIEERDEGTLLALQTTPLPLSRFLGYRLVAGMALSVVLSVLGVALAGLVQPSPVAVLASAGLASLAVPLVALAYAIFLGNKLQAVASGKLVQAWAGLPALLFFLPAPVAWLASVALPAYFPMRLFWGACQGHPEWWLIAPGVLVQGAALAWLLRRFRRATFV